MPLCMWVLLSWIHVYSLMSVLLVKTTKKNESCATGERFLVDATKIRAPIFAICCTRHFCCAMIDNRQPMWNEYLEWKTCWNDNVSFGFYCFASSLRFTDELQFMNERLHTLRLNSFEEGVYWPLWSIWSFLLQVWSHVTCDREKSKIQWHRIEPAESRNFPMCSTPKCTAEFRRLWFIWLSQKC